MRAEWKSLDPDVKRRRDPAIPEKKVDGHGSRETVQPPTPVVACGDPNGFERPANHGIATARRGNRPSATPVLSDLVDARKAEQAETDVQPYKNQKSLKGQSEA